MCFDMRQFHEKGSYATKTSCHTDKHHAAHDISLKPCERSCSTDIFVEKNMTGRALFASPKAEQAKKNQSTEFTDFVQFKSIARYH